MSIFNEHAIHYCNEAAMRSSIQLVESNL